MHKNLLGRHPRALIVAACTLVAWTGCAQQPIPGGQGSGVLPAGANFRARDGALPSQLLFVTNEDGTIGIYPLKHPNKTGPLAMITGLKASQQQMTVDTSGNLFVVNNGASAGDDYVSVFAPPYTSPPTILSTVWNNEIFFPVGVTVDSQGTAYVSNCGSYCLETPAIYVYPAGATAPAKAITSKNFNSLAGLAIDSKGDVFAVNWNVATLGVDVFEIAAGSSQPKPLHLHGLVTGNGGNGISLDAQGNLYVGGTGSGSNYILAYKPEKHHAYHLIDSLPFTDSPQMIDVGPDGNLYVPIGCSFAPCTAVDAFKPHAKQPFESIGSSQTSTFIGGVATAPNLQLRSQR